MINLDFEKEIINLHQLNGYVVSERLSGGNSSILRLSKKDSKDFALKIYSGDLERNLTSLNHELNAFEILATSRINIANLNAFTEKFPSISYSWIEGSLPQRNSSTTNAISECIEELSSLYKLNPSELIAIDAIESSADLHHQLINRIDILQAINGFPEEWIDKFILREKELRILLEDGISFGFDILSFSDFGHHNMLRSKNGKYYFVDFEFFGKDSTVKLFGDLFSHPKGSLTSQELKKLANTLNLNERKKMEILKLLPAIALKWAFIASRRTIDANLNVFIGINSSFDHPLKFIEYSKFISKCKSFDDLVTYTELKKLT